MTNALLEEARAQLCDAASNEGSAGLAEQLKELRHLRMELDEKAEALQAECRAHEVSVTSAAEPPKAAEGTANAEALGRELALAREKGLELSSALAAKEAEATRSYSEAQRAAQIISKVRRLKC